MSSLQNVLVSSHTGVGFLVLSICSHSSKWVVSVNLEVKCDDEKTPTILSEHFVPKDDVSLIGPFTLIVFSIGID